VARVSAMVRRSGAERLVTTRKDWMKMRARAWACEVVRPVAGVRWIEGGDRIETAALAALG